MQQRSSITSRRLLLIVFLFVSIVGLTAFWAVPIVRNRRKSSVPSVPSEARKSVKLRLKLRPGLAWRLALATFLLVVISCMTVFQVSSIFGYQRQPGDTFGSVVYHSAAQESALMKLVHSPGFSSSCNHTGVTYNSGPPASYSFAQLQVSNIAGTTYYQITDNSLIRCPIYLRGVEHLISDTAASAERNYATPYTQETYGEQDIDYISQNVPLNLMRLSVNPEWWVNNYVVPDMGFIGSPGPGQFYHYQDWVKRVVSRIENDGMYVEITSDPQFFEPPCDESHTVTPLTTPDTHFCPPQDTGVSEYNASLGTLPPNHSKDPDCLATATPFVCDATAVVETSYGNYVDAAQTMFTQLASIYQSDSAVIYDTWNETHAYEDGTACTPTPSAQVTPTPGATPGNGTCAYLWGQNQQKLFNAAATATVNPSTPSVSHLLVTDWGVGTGGIIGDNGYNLYYTAVPNLVLDQHEYRQGFGVPYISTYVAIAYAHGHAVIINEWGDTEANETETPDSYDGAQTEPYNGKINGLAQGTSTTNSNGTAVPYPGGQFSLDYYTLSNLYSGGTGGTPSALNCEGVALLNDNLNVWGSGAVSITPTVTPVGTCTGD